MKRPEVAEADRGQLQASSGESLLSTTIQAIPIARTREFGDRCHSARFLARSCTSVHHPNAVGYHAEASPAAPETLRSMQAHSKFASCSGSMEQSANIFRNSPKPRVRPRMGTTVARPSECRRKQWLPRIRSAVKPARSNARTSSFPVGRGRVLMRRQSLVECR